MFDTAAASAKQLPVGISVSAVSMLLLACLLSLCLTLYAAICLEMLLTKSRGGVGWVIQNGVVICSGLIFSLLSFWGWKGLYAERAWALWIARIWATLLLLFGALSLYRMYRPHAPAPDEYFGFLYDPILIIGGAAWLIYLSLPKVRERF